MRFNRKPTTTANDAELQEEMLFTEDLPSDAPTNIGLARRSRIGLTVVLLGLVLAVVVALAPRWSGPVRQAWAQAFPPPPYHGPLVYGVNLIGALVALRASDGSIQWIEKQSSGNSTLFIQNKILLTNGVVNHVEGIVALRASDGYTLWSLPNPAGYSQPYLIALVGTQVFVWYPSGDGSQSSLLEAVDWQQGRVQWTMPINGLPQLISAAGNNNLVMCMAATGSQTGQALQLRGVDAPTGKLLWQISPILQNPGPNDSLFCDVGQGHLYLEKYQGGTNSLTAYQALDGTPLWQRKVSGFVATMDATSLYFTDWFIDQPFTTPRTLTAINASDGSDGSQRWQLLGQFTALFYADLLPTSSNIIVMRTPQGIAGIDSRSGVIAWQMHSPTDLLQSYQAVHGAGDTLFYANADTLFALNQTTGSVFWQRQIPISPNGVQLVYANQQLYLLIANRSLQALDPATGHTLWQTTNINALIG